MLTTMIVIVTFILVFTLFIFTKQDMLKQLFTNRLAKPTNELQDQLELTANTVIENLESHITQLEFLLEQSDSKLELMDQKLQSLDQTIQQAEGVEKALQQAQISQKNEPDDFIPLYQVQPPKPLNEPKPLPYGFNQYRQQIEHHSGLPEQETEAETTVSPLILTEETRSGAQSDAVAKQVIQEQRPVILTMAEQGYTLTEIAKATGLGKGEITLFLELHKNS